MSIFKFNCRRAWNMLIPTLLGQCRCSNKAHCAVHLATEIEAAVGVMRAIAQNNICMKVISVYFMNNDRIITSTAVWVNANFFAGNLVSEDATGRAVIYKNGIEVIRCTELIMHCVSRYTADITMGTSVFVVAVASVNAVIVCANTNNHVKGGIDLHRCINEGWNIARKGKEWDRKS